MSLRNQLLLLQALIVCAVVLGTGIVAVSLSERQVRDAYLDRMIGVAQSVARLPAIHDAFDDDDPAAVIQPIAEVIREASNVTYVVVTDARGIRYSHPDTDRIGEQVSTDPSIPLSGEMYVGTQTATTLPGCRCDRRMARWWAPCLWGSSNPRCVTSSSAASPASSSHSWHPPSSASSGRHG